MEMTYTALLAPKVSKDVKATAYGGKRRDKLSQPKWHTLVDASDLFMFPEDILT